MRKWAAGIVLASGIVPLAHAACEAHSSATQPHLVELYTSEGCSSCPPADAWLRHLSHNADVVPLAFHVDYWDALGWRDRFASARYTDRQQEQARRERSTAVYTPKVVLDGRSWPNWYRSVAFPGAQRSRIALAITAARGAASLQVHLESTALDGVDINAYRSYVALVEDGLSSDVRAGENRGVTLRHDHVVRSLAGPLPTGEVDVRIDVPADVENAKAALVAFVQNPLSGDIAQALMLPLVQCR
jgi:hypothetical protein